MEVDLNNDLLDGIVIDEAPEGPAVAASSSAASSSSADALPVLPVGTITDQPFEFELREIKEEEDEADKKQKEEEEEASVEEEIPEEEAEEEEKEKEKETEGTVEEEENDKGKGKEPTAPQESSEEKERRLKREKEAKALPPLQPLPAPAVNKIFERLPEEMRLSITDTDETPVDELPFQPREKSVNPPSKNERRVELSFPPPPTPPKTEEEMEKERKQQEKEELARRKKEQKEIEQLNKMAFMDDKQRLKAEEKMRKEKEKDEKKEKEKAAKAETSRMAAISNRSGQLDAKLKEAKQIAAQKAEEELRMLRTLTVTRYTPEGNQASVQLSQIVITFNHPLLPPPEKTEGEEEEEDEEVDKEVKLDDSLLEWKPEIEPAPMVEGEWWIGGTSLVYRTPSGTPLDQCWACATEYKVTVPEGVQSKAGELPVLGEAFSFSFRTPTIKVESTYPHHNATRISLRPLFFVCFDQIIDSKEEILQQIRLYIPPSGSPLKASYHDDPSIKEYASLHLLSEEEEKEELNRHTSVVRQPFDSNAEGRWMCLACDEALPHDKRVVLQIGPDLPSAEGPLRSKDCHVLSFQTVPPFVVTHYRHTGLVSGRQTLAITFNQDIIPSTSASFGFSDLPCLPYITPDPEEHNEEQGSSSTSSSSSICAGTWSLNANNSLLYTPYRDWKKATEFTVTVPPDICGLYHAQLRPAKTTATPGGLCSKNLQWNFHTPTPSYTQTFPTNGLSNVLVNTPILVIFDQKIRPKKVIKRMSVWYEQKKLMMTNKKNVALQLVKSLDDLPSSAFSSEQEADRLKDMIEKAPERQWVLATPAERLPFGTSCHLQLGPKLPSAEGPYADPDKIQHISFSTVSRFQVSYVQPGNKGYMTSPAGHVSVFFNHPLVRWKGTHDDLEWRFEISPELESEGTWSTPSSHELRFTPNSNWAGSTQYTITVPAGVKSYLGDELEEEYTTTFTTSVLAVTQYSYLHHTSSASVGEIRDPPVWVCFNQIIDAEQVLKQISMTYSGSMFRSTSVPLRLMDYDEVMECEQAQHLISDQNEGYWLAFKPAEKLPFATDVTVTIGPDLPSAEGSLLSSHKTTFGFKTIPPFLCTNSLPLGYVSNVSSANVRLYFNQPLVNPSNQSLSIDEMNWLPTLSPEPKQKGTWTLVSAYTLDYTPNAWDMATTYTVTVDAGVRSFYGEQLDKLFSFEFFTPAAEIVRAFPCAIPTYNFNKGASVDTPMALLFNQAVDPDQALEKLSVHVNDGMLSFLKKPYGSLSLIQPNALSNLPALEKFYNGLSASEQAACVMFSCNKTFPHNSTITVKLAAGLVSREGSRVTPKEQSSQFSTVAAFGVQYASPTKAIQHRRTVVKVQFTQPLVPIHQRADIQHLSWRPIIQPFPSMIEPLRCVWRTSQSFQDLKQVTKKNGTELVWKDVEAEESVQAQLELSPSDGIPYFEVKVKSCAKNGCIAVGAALIDLPLHKMLPGWKSHSYGYHSDDAHIYNDNKPTESSALPKWGVGDVIGCGIDAINDEIYWTLNGEKVVAQKLGKKDKKLLPTVGADNGAKLWINLGSAPFAYDPKANSSRPSKKGSKKSSPSKAEKKEKKNKKKEKKTPRKDKEQEKEKAKEKVKEKDTITDSKQPSPRDKEKDKEDEEEQPVSSQQSLSAPSSSTTAPPPPPITGVVATRIQPPPKAPSNRGAWTLVDHHTLLFYPMEPWQNSTEFTVTVPEGVSSYYQDQRLEKHYSFKFTTPTIRILKLPLSNTRQLLDAPIYVRFNQLIDAQEMIKNVQVSISKWKFSSFAPVRLLKKKEINHPSALNPAFAGYWLCFKCTEPFPYDTTVTVKIGPKLKSIEGTLETTQEQTFSFTTIGDFAVINGTPKGQQSYYKVPVVLEFNQPLLPPGAPLDINSLSWRPKIEPEPLSGGSWSLLNSRKLCYRPDEHWEKSTQYTVTVDADIISGYNEPLKKPYTLTFSTKTMLVRFAYPRHGRSLLDAGMFILFDQIVDPEAVLATIKISTSFFKSSYAPVRLMTSKQVKRSNFAHLATEELEGHWVAFESTKMLPPNSTVTVTVGPKIPSAEGDVPSESTYTWQFKTVPRFKVDRFFPKNTNTKIYPRAPWSIRFSNPLNQTAFDPRAITVEPTLPDLNVCVTSGKTIQLYSSMHEGDTVYRVTIVSSAIKDVYGQPLGIEHAEEVEDEGEEGQGNFLIEDIVWEVKVWEPPVPRALKPFQDGLIVYDPVLLAATQQPPTYHIKVYNYKELRVCLYKMNPRKHWHKWGTEKNYKSVGESKSDTHDYLGYGKLVADDIVPVSNYQKDTYVDFIVDLSPALKDSSRGVGQIAIVITPTKKGHYPNSWSDRDIVKAWIQLTHIGLDAFQGLQSVHAWATHLVKGGPIKGAKFWWHEREKTKFGAGLTILDADQQMKKLAALNQQTSPRGGSNQQGSQARIAPTTALSLRPMTLERDVSGPFVSNKEGVAVLPHNTTKAATLFVEKGKDCAFITGVSTFTSLSADTMLLWHVFDDRSMYRPKEEVHIKGYVRFLKRLSNEHFERLELPSLQNVNYRMVDPRSVEVAKGSSCLSGFGSFDFVLNLPDSINLGDVSLHLSLEDHEQTSTYAHVHTFQVQEFRRPEFVAEASVESKNPHFLDPSSKAILKGKASYYAGGGLPDSDATWRVASTDATFAPPGLMDYVFSSQTKLLIKEEDIKQVTSSSSISITSFSLVGNDAGSSSDGALQLVVPKKRVSLIPTPFVHSSSQRSSSDCKRTVKGKTRPSGEHKIEILLKSGIPNPPRPLSLAAVLEVMDLNHQTLNATTQLLLHPCAYYVGLQAQESTILMDRPCRIRIVVSNIDGKLVAGVPVYLTLTRWVQKPYYRQSSSPSPPPPPPIHQAIVHRTPLPPSSSSSTMDIIPSLVPSAWEDITIDNKTPNYQKHVVISGSKPIEYELNFSSSNSNDSLVISCDIHALVEDGEGRKNAAELSLPVQSSAPSLPPSPTSLYPSVPPPVHQQQDKEFEVIAEETLVITSDKTSYRIGETAELLIQCPFAPADALVTARCRGIVKTFLYKLKSTSEVVRVPILEEYAPSINIQVDTVGLAKRSNLDNKEEENAPPRPALATATIELIVPPTTRELTVTVTPQHTKVIPGGETVVSVRVTDHKGQAIKRAAEVAIVVVDEAVLALSNHSLSNPLQTFYPTRPTETKRQRFANRTHISVEKWDNKQLDPPTLHLEQLTADWSDDEEVALSDDEIDVAQLIEAIKDEEETWPEPQPESEPVDDVKVQYSSDEEIADQEEEEEDQEYFNEYGADEEQECREKLAECAFDDGICLEEMKCAEKSRQRRASSSRSLGRGGGGGGPLLQGMLHSSGIPPPPRSSLLAYDMAGGCPPPPPAGAPCASNASLMMPSYSASPSSSSSSSFAIQRECAKMDSFSPMAEMECASFAKSAAPRKAMKKKGGFGISLPAPSLPSFGRSSAAPVHQRKEMKKKSIAKDKSFSRAKKMERNARAESDDDDCEEADEEEEYEGEMLAEAEEEVCPIIAVRSNFNPLANFTASVLVDDDGKAQIDVKIPDSLTRYRIWAVAVSRDGKSYGLGENLIIAQLPLVVRCTPPRFLNFGDSFELSIIIQNQLEQTLDIDIGIRVSHHVEIITSEEDGTETGVRETGFKGHVIGEGRRLVTVPMRTKSVGMACFQVSCSSGKYGDAANVQIPIYPPATAESFAQYGSLPGDVEVIQKQITKPAGALPQFGALELSASSTMMQGLLDAVYYLYSYPNECCEQISSKLLGLVALHDVLDSFPSDKLPKRKELKSLVSADLKRLKKRQSKNGGFGMWTAHSTVDPFVSCHVAHCLGLCKAKGFSLPFFIESRIVSYLKDVLFNDIRTYSPDARALITSYALYARYRLSPDASIKQEAEQYYASHAPDELPMEALGLLLSIFADTSTTGTLMFKKQQKRSACADEVVRYLANHIKVDKDTGLAHAPSYYDELSRHSLLHSNYRVDAMLLEGFVMADPEHELVAPLAKGLLAMRRNGTWLNTQENAWATIALNRYFTVCEKDKPDFAVRFWLAEQYCGEALFKGRNADTKFIRVPMLEFSKCAQKANSVRAAGDLTFGQVDLHRSAALSKEGSKVGLALAINLAEAKKTKKGRKEEEEKDEGKKKGSLLQVPGSEQSSSSPRKESKSPRKDSSKSPRKDSTKSPKKDSSSSSSSSSSGKSPRKEEKTSKKDKGKSPRKGTKIEESKSSSPRDSAKNKKKGEEKYPAEVADLLLQKEGKGRLYYRLGMSYAPADLVIPAKSFGFTVQRRFSAVITDDEKDTEKKKQQEEKVKQDKDGVWHVVKGSLVRVTLTVTANFPRYNIALVDKLAAGLEAENPAINKVTKDKSVKEEEEEKGKEKEKDKITVWWQHQNLRDERVECYASELAKGVEYKYEYIARATSEGRFVVPPCRCEEMYNPDLYGHTASTILVVESEKKEE